MDRLQAMKVLLAVVEAGSLSAASRRLSVPLATVSRRIAELEAHLGVQAAQPDEPQARSHRGRPRLHRRGAAHPRRGRRGRARGGRRICRAEGRPHHHRAAGVRPAACAAGRRRIPQGLSRGRRAARAQRPHRQPRAKTMSTSPCGSASCRTAAWSRLRVGSISRIVCGSPAYFAARGRPLAAGRARRPRLRHLRQSDAGRSLGLHAAASRRSPRRSARGCRSTRPRRRSTRRSPASG